MEMVLQLEAGKVVVVSPGERWEVVIFGVYCDGGTGGDGVHEYETGTGKI
jgi:hypothetical protein